MIPPLQPAPPKSIADVKLATTLALGIAVDDAGAATLLGLYNATCYAYKTIIAAGVPTYDEWVAQFK